VNNLVIYPAFLDFQEIVIIMVVAVVIFGPDKIPEIARGLGSAVRKLKEASEDIKQEIMNPVQDVDPTKDIQRTIKELNPMNEVEDSFKEINPIKDFQKSFDEVRNPVDEIHNSIHNDSVVEEKSDVLKDESVKTELEITQAPITEEKSIEKEDTPEEEKPSVNDVLGMGGTISR
jgi:TatA/E family protein of Tat protein translocase